MPIVYGMHLECCATHLCVHTAQAIEPIISLLFGSPGILPKLTEIQGIWVASVDVSLTRCLVSEGWSWNLPVVGSGLLLWQIGMGFCWLLWTSFSTDLLEVLRSSWSAGEPPGMERPGYYFHIVHLPRHLQNDPLDLMSLGPRGWSKNQHMTVPVQDWGDNLSFPLK